MSLILDKVPITFLVRTSLDQRSHQRLAFYELVE